MRAFFFSTGVTMSVIETYNAAIELEQYGHLLWLGIEPIGEPAILMPDDVRRLRDALEEHEHIALQQRAQAIIDKHIQQRAQALIDEHSKSLLY